MFIEVQHGDGWGTVMEYMECMKIQPISQY